MLSVRGYLRMWKYNLPVLVALILVVALVVGVVLLSHYEHDNFIPY